MIKPVIICEIDGVVASTAKRDTMYIDHDWPVYNEAAINDPPLTSGIALVNALASRFLVVAVTTRPETYRALLLRWLATYDCRFDQLLMRPASDFTRGSDMKIALCRSDLGALFPQHVAFAIDSNEYALNAYAEHGIPGLLMINGDLKP